MRTSASVTAPAGSSTKRAWTASHWSRYRSRASGSSGLMSKSLRRCSRSRSSASASRLLEAPEATRSYSGPNRSLSAVVRRERWAAHAITAIATSTMTAIRIHTHAFISRSPFVLAPIRRTRAVARLTRLHVERLERRRRREREGRRDAHGGRTLLAEDRRRHGRRLLVARPLRHAPELLVGGGLQVLEGERERGQLAGRVRVPLEERGPVQRAELCRVLPGAPGHARQAGRVRVRLRAPGGRRL